HRVGFHLVHELAEGDPPAGQKVAEGLGVGVAGSGLKVAAGAGTIKGVVAVLDPGPVRGGSFVGADLADNVGEQVGGLGELGEAAVEPWAAVGVVGVGQQLEVFVGVGE